MNWWWWRRPRESQEKQPSTVGFREALGYWIRLGFINFGGPAGQIAIMHRDLVDRRRWVSNGEFLRALNFCMVLPGPEAQQLATYVGWRLHGLVGGLMAGLWFILPSVFVLLGLSWLVAAHGNVAWVAGLLYGVQPVVVAIVVEAIMRIGRRTLHHWGLFLFAAAAFLANYVFKVPFPLIVLTAAVLGLMLGRWWPHVFGPREQTHFPGEETSSSSKAAAAFPPVSRAIGILAVFFVLWAVPVGALVLWWGVGSVHVQEALFFTGAAFVTFGGAYSVLSYVAASAVNVYGWLGPDQMIQGLALAESTPGPLIMVLQYVGFLGGWNLPGDLSPFLSGLLGAFTVTYVTFLPSFMFIFVGAPYIEALAGQQRLQAAMTGVTAAVVGVILNLAVFFGGAVLFPQGAGGARLDLVAVGLAITAFLALWRWHWPIPVVVLGGAILGMGWRLLGPTAPL